MNIKDHAIETEEHYVFDERKCFLSKRVYSDLIYFEQPYINNQKVSETLKNIYSFIDPSSANTKNIGLNTRFDLVTGNPIFYDTLHKVNYKTITQEGLDYFYGQICSGFSEPEVIKILRERDVDINLAKITVKENASISSITFAIRLENIKEITSYLKFNHLENLLTLFDTYDNIINPTWFLRFGVDSPNVWIGFSDNISPEIYFEEYLYPDEFSFDFYQIKKDYYKKLVEMLIITPRQYEYIINNTKGRQPTTTFFLMDRSYEVGQIHFENMITYKFEEI